MTESQLELGFEYLTDMNPDGPVGDVGHGSVDYARGIPVEFLGFCKRLATIGETQSAMGDGVRTTVNYQYICTLYGSSMGYVSANPDLNWHFESPE